MCSLSCGRFSQAIEDELIESNPALRLGRFNHPQAEDRKAEFLTREESQAFLAASMALRPERYPLFLAALRAGLRLGELLGLKWDDIQFGENESDSNRYILVRNNFTRGEFTSPKNRKTRRVNLNRELRQNLIELRDARLMDAFARGHESIPGLVFPSQTGGPLDSAISTIVTFCLASRPPDCAGSRSTRCATACASLLIQGGTSLAYVRDQMGHSSIQVTADVYGHLVPGGNIGWIDRLSLGTSPGQTSLGQNAPPAQLAIGGKTPEMVQAIENSGRRGGTRTPDPRIRNPMLYPAELHPRKELH
jgi:integrase